ncbi:SusD/RagB family nutrient-binding outer membrane lipoprotein [Pontibacter cellulosilyticus]|uniref:SusD/RagB family nutrient-binding outer membrane lipoprotein n=1 Tax=Pontibacter cellulosilyticus TaxID=1720253 RepID=A0A923N8J7_9BACT|nr:SusD/RagB family nutrient-binding outer membrane lipoprotein [Pontibacter cellulosilyticus]MBC5994783.1 SusD/RagB family nutrient-binding outer membrane lipoprotein [Pontibacter cellulosilyticus]
MKKIFRYITIFSLAVSVMGCEGFIEGFEEDPNNPSGESVDVNNMIQGVMLGNALLHEGEMARLAGMWTDQFSGVDRQYINLDQYLVTAGDFDSPWSTIYYASITQARLAQEKAENELNPKVLGVAQILEAHAAGTAASLFGDVPFSEVTKVESPKFDPQLEVYANVQKLLDDAIANLKLGKGILKAEKDIYFSGKALNWINVAYTLKARYYMHVGDYAKAETAAMLGIPSPAGNMITPHDDAYYNVNVYYSFGQLEREGYMTAEGAFAPRILDPAQANVFAKNRNNAKTDEVGRFKYHYKGNLGTYDLNYSGAFGYDEDFPLVTYAETQLILAEARARQDNLTGALGALNERRDALNEIYGRDAIPAVPATPTTPEVPEVPEYVPYKELLLTDFAVGGVENTAGLSVKDALLNEILEERYVTFIGNIEAFNDARRTDNRIGIPIKGTASELPQRFLYPQSEVNANPNVPNPLPGLFEATAVNK